MRHLICVTSLLSYSAGFISTEDYHCSFLYASLSIFNCIIYSPKSPHTTMTEKVACLLNTEQTHRNQPGLLYWCL